MIRRSGRRTLTLMSDVSGPPPRQRLRSLSGAFRVERGRGAEPGSVTVFVRDPDGVTVVRAATADDPPEELWHGLRGVSAHDLDQPGMLAALLVPLADAGVPVFVASTFDADLVFVPVERRDAAVGALRAAGHIVEP
ncbi:hypothetical protein Airi01_036870 [Actinoallomurus iriomotensis]|uniref:CASTOR ACT domain-containing protein n=1 Tax=Actinoallomurus iriomotensis TaxID=478107 RepID=A0A9W6RII1_9ACTN|nr:hypothetical protein Airi01_036870 [Actinoallomurus iriomotensis]